MPVPCTEEFRDDVVNVARNRAPGRHRKQIAVTPGSASRADDWTMTADVAGGAEPGTTAAENPDVHGARKRIRLVVLMSVPPAADGWAA